MKKLDPSEVEKERNERKGNWRQSIQLLQGLQDTLQDTLDQRHLALFSDSESDEEDDYVSILQVNLFFATNDYLRMTMTGSSFIRRLISIFYLITVTCILQLA